MKIHFFRKIQITILSLIFVFIFSFLFPQKVHGADVTIDTAAILTTSHGMRSMVFTSPSKGYFFFIDDDSDFKYLTTTDGGQNWHNLTTIYTGSVTDYDVWFDQWTPGDVGTIIHTWYIESGTDDVRYRQLDTANDQLMTESTVVALSSASSNARGTFISGAKARGGNLLVAFDIDAAAEMGTYRSIDGGKNWTARTNMVEATLDQLLMFPGNEADSQDMWALYHDADADALTLKVHDDSENTNSESSTIVSLVDQTTNGTGQYGFTGSIRHSDGHLLVATFSAYDNAGTDFQTWDINGTGSITEKTAITTDKDDMYYPSIFIDQTTDDVYVAYIGKRDGSEILGTTNGVYYTKSTDDMANWSAGDTAYSAAASDHRQTWVPLMGPRFMVAYRDLSDQALYTNYDNSIGIGSDPTYCISQVTTGNWNTAGTWDCGHVPTTGENVIINLGDTITMDVNSAVLGDIIINGTLNTSDGTSRNLSGTSINITSTGTLVANASTITLGGSWINVHGTFTRNTSTVVFSGNQSQIITSGSISTLEAFYNLTINKVSNTVGVVGDLVVMNDFTLTSGTFVSTNQTFYVFGDFSDNGGTFTHNNGTVHLKSSASANTFTVQNGTTFYNLIINDPDEDNLSGYWKLDEENAGDTVEDSSSNNNDGTTPNGDPTPSTDTPGLLFENPKSYDFDGTDDYVRVPYSSSINTNGMSEFSVSVWVNRDSLVDGAIIAQFGSGTYQGWMIWRPVNNPVYRFYVNAATRAAVNASNAGVWQHITAVWDGTNVKMYSDGILIQTAASPLPNNANADIIVGAYYNNGPSSGGGVPSWRFDGRIDDIRIYSRALSDSEVLDLANGHELFGSNTITLAGGAPIVDNTMTLNSGTFSTGNLNLSLNNLVMNGGTFTAGSSTIFLTGTGTVFDAQGGTFSAGTSTIRITDETNANKTFAGGGQTFNNVWFKGGAGGGSYVISGDNTFNDFKDDGSTAHSLYFTAGSTQTINTFTVNGTAGELIAIDSTTTDTHALVSTGSDINVDYVSVQHSVASGTGSWNAGANSVDNNSVPTAGSGWNFGDAVTCTSQVAIGNWNTAGTWDCGHVPTTGENVVIDAGDDITMDVNSASLGDLVISGKLNTSDGTSRDLTAATLTINSAGTLIANSSNISLSGASGTLFTRDASGIFTYGTSTLVLSGNGDATINSEDTDFYSITSSGTGTKSLGDHLTINGDLIISAGTFQISTFVFAVVGTTSITGTFADNSTSGASIFTGMVTVNSGGTWDSSGNDGFSFRGGLTVNSSSTFISGSGNYLFANNAQSIGGTQAFTIENITNNITSGNGLTFASNNPTVTTLTQGTNGVLTFSGTVPTITTLTATASPNTVQYTGGTQTVIGTTYHHLTINGTDTKTLGASTSVNGNLTITAGTLALSTFDLTVTGTTSITGTLNDASATGTNIFVGAVTVNNGGTWSNSNNPSFTFRGGLTVNSTSTFSSGSGTYTFNTNAQEIGGTQSFTITNLNNDITSSTGLTFASNNPTVTTLTQGTNAILTFSGTVPTITTLTATVSPNTVVYSGTAQTVKGTTYHHLIVDGTDTKTLGASTSVNGDLTITASTLQISTLDLTVSGATSVTGTIDDSSSIGTNIFVGAVTVNNGGTWTSTGNESYTFRGGLTVNSTSTFTSGSGVYTFDTNAQEIGGTQAFTITNLTNSVTTGTGLTFPSNNPTVTSLILFTNSITSFSGTVPTVSSMSFYTGSIVRYVGADQNIIPSSGYQSIYIGGTGTKTQTGQTLLNGNIEVASGTTLQIAGFNFTVGGTTTIGGVIDDNSTAGGFTLIGAVVIQSGGTWTSSGNESYIFRGGLTVDSGASFTSGSGTYTFNTNAQSIGGTQSFTITNLTNSITTGDGLTFTSNNPTVTTLTNSANSILTFSGTVPTITTLTATATGNIVQYTGSTQTVKNATYYDLVINGSGTATLGGNSTINNNLTISAGTLALSTYDITVTGTTSITGTLNDASATGTNIFVGAVTVNNGGTWSNSNNPSFTFRGGLTVNSTSTFSSGSGTYTFNTNAQEIGGTQSFTITNLNNDITSSTGLTFASNNPTVTTLTQGTNAILTFSGTVPTITTLTATASGNTVQYTGGSQTVKGTTYHHLTLSGSGNVSPGANTTVNGTLTIGESVTLDPTTSYTFTGSGTNVLDVTGIIKVQHSTFAGSYISFETVTLNSGSTVNYALNGAQTVDGSFDYYNLTISGGNTKTASEAFALATNGTLAVDAGTFDPGTYLVTGTGTNTLTVANGATLKVGASTFAGSYSAGFTTRTLDSGSIIDYARSGDQTIDSTLSMSNMTVSGSGTKSLDGATTVSLTTTVSAGTLDMTTSNYALNTGALVLSGGTVLARGSVISLTGTGTVFTYSSGTFTPGTSTLRLTDASASAKTFAGGGQTYNNIHFDGGAGTGSYTISGSNTFNEFKDTGTAGHSILFTAGTTTTISDWRVVGSANNLISLNSTVPTQKWYLENTYDGYTIASNFISLRDSEVISPTLSYAGYNSVNDTTGGSTNVGWTFNENRPQGGGAVGNLEASEDPDPQQGGGGQEGGDDLEEDQNPDPGQGGGGAGGGDDLGFMRYLRLNFFAIIFTFIS